MSSNPSLGMTHLYSMLIFSLFLLFLSLCQAYQPVSAEAGLWNCFYAITQLSFNYICSESTMSSCDV